MSLIIQNEIEKLKKSILQVGTLVEESLNIATRSFLERDFEIAESVVGADDEIDQLEVEVEEECLKILALHQPVAIDLRFIISVLKINNDLERIGDLAANIAGRTMALANEPEIQTPGTITRMTEIVQSMLRDSLDALVNLDRKKAIRVCEMDDEVDDLHHGMYHYVYEKMLADPTHAESWLQLIGVSRYLERSADHCTNIAQDVLYLVDGSIYRHRDLED